MFVNANCFAQSTPSEMAEMSLQELFFENIDGKYVENIEFFSKDGSRVGAVLPFDYQIVEGEWHHSGLSSKGDPIYEIWTPRKMLDEVAK